MEKDGEEGRVCVCVGARMCACVCVRMRACVCIWAGSPVELLLCFCTHTHTEVCMDLGNEDGQVRSVLRTLQIYTLQALLQQSSFLTFLTPRSPTGKMFGFPRWNMEIMSAVHWPTPFNCIEGQGERV